MATTSTTLASDVRNFIAEETLRIAEIALRFYQFGNKANLPDQHGTVFQYARYNRLPLPTVTLTEGTNPVSVPLGVTMVSATAEQLNAPLFKYIINVVDKILGADYVPSLFSTKVMLNQL